MKKIKPLMIFLLVLGFAFSNSFVLANESQKILEKKNQLEYIKGQIKQRQYAIEEINRSASKLTQEVQSIDDLVQQTQLEIMKIEREINEKENYMNSIDQRKELTKQKLNQTLLSFEDISRKMTAGETNYLKWSTSTDSSLLVSLRLQQLNQVHSIYEKAVKKNKSDIINMNAQEGSLLIERDNLEKDRKVVLQKQAFIREQYEKKSSLLGELSDQKDTHESHIYELGEVSLSVEKAIKTLQAAGYTKYSSSMKKGSGVMIWPTHGGYKTSDFGYRIHPIENTKSYHNGMDIGGRPEGSLVLAGADGIVISSGWISGYGYTVIIDHGNNISTLYAHNSKLLVKSGDVVKQGQNISKVGTTGVSTAPHIHFEVRVNGKPVNPLEWL